MKVPIVDLARQHAPLADEIVDAVSHMIGAGAFVGGPEVEGFEREFAAYLGVAETITCSSGTAALGLALRALGLTRRDEVVLPANSFVATAEAVVLAGGTPVFCDVDERTGLVTREHLEAALTERSRVVVPVHLWGHVVDMAPILALAGTRGLLVLEDSAQAHGARYRDGRRSRAGSLGHAAAFSFYPAKNLGAIGEGGACAVADPELALRIRMIRDHGQQRKHVHEVVGDNARLAAIQAAALRIKLRHLDRWNARRREIAARYARALREVGVRFVETPPWSESVFHQFVIRVSERDEWANALAERGVGTAVHYPVPIHLQPAFSGARHPERRLPNVERLAGEVLSLPIFPELTDEEVEHVIASIQCVARRRSVEVAQLTGTDRG